MIYWLVSVVIVLGPLISDHALAKQKIKMAMSLLGKNKQYHWDKIQARHFISTAAAVGFSEEKMKTLILEMTGKLESVIEQVESNLVKKFPENCPENIAQSVFAGMRAAAKKLSNSTTLLLDF